jgi:trimeric autotransporter adhesin
MLRTILHRLRWPLLGAGAAALILTTMTALAGSGVGSVFNLGQVNTVNGTSTLTGSTGGPQLKVVNTNTASHSIVAQAGGGSGIALYGQHTTTAGTGPAIRGDSASTAANAFSIYGLLSSTTPGSPSAAIRAQSNSTSANGYALWASKAGTGTAVYGTSPSGTAVLGKHTGSSGVGSGVEGDSASAANAGVIGKNTAGGPGLQATVNSSAIAPLKVNSTAKVASLNADLLDGLDSTALPYWKLGGNAGTTPGTNFIGTSDNKALELKVNGQRALRLEPNATSPNLIGGFSGNSVGFGESGSVIAGGGNGGTGNPNTVYGSYDFVGAGTGNQAGIPAGGDNAAVVAGTDNVASGGWSFVGSGFLNKASGDYSAVIAGLSNQASAIHSTVVGGLSNVANGDHATVVGGFSNTAGGNSTVIGGANNTAVGPQSYAAGTHAKATLNGAFVWGDNTATDLTSPAVNSFTVRASGGIWLGTTSSPAIPANHFVQTSTGGYLSSAGVWTDNSDRAVKHDFLALNKQTVLKKLAHMPITSWSYKAEPPSVRHIGPVAQDFYSAFGLGLDNKHIGTIDEGGVALAAIQGLYRQNQALIRQNRALGSRLSRLERQMRRLARKGR